MTLSRSMLLTWMLLAVSSSALAAGKDIPAMRREAAAWLRDEVSEAYPDVTVQVEIGTVDSRLHLASCDGFSFFLPPGSRLWSGGSLGVRCGVPLRWTLYVTYQVQLSGPALTAAQPLPARHLLGQGDLVPGKVKYEQEPGSYLQKIPPRAMTQRPMTAGQPMLVYDLLLPNVIQAGSRVRVKISGRGFSLAQEGQALNAAKAGGSVQVRMPSGTIVRGTATPAGEVELQP